MHAINDISTVRRAALYVGIPALVVAVLMTFQFGRSMSFLHAICLGLLTIAGSIIWPYVKHIKSESKTAGYAFMMIGALFLSVEYFSHLGYTVGTRVIETQNTGVTNAKYENNQKAVKDDEANLDLWRKQLDELKTLKPWAATVSADGLRANLAVMDKDIELETARGGCKSKCRKLMADKAATEEKIASAEEVVDLTKRIEATQRILDGKRTAANTTEFHTSSVVSQTNFVAQIATGSLDPDAMSMTWTQIAIGALIALVSTFLAPVMLTIALGPVTGSEAASTQANALNDRLAKMTQKRAPEATAQNASGRTEVHNHVGILDDTVAREMLARIASSIKVPSLKAA